MEFSAILLDGRILTNADVPSVSLLPLSEVVELTVQGIHLLADVKNGERVRFFTRHIVPIGDPELGKVAVPVLELQKEDKTLCRLYWHPERGPLMTSQDLYFA